MKNKLVLKMVERFLGNNNIYYMGKLNFIKDEFTDCYTAKFTDIKTEFEYMVTVHDTGNISFAKITTDGSEWSWTTLL